MRTKTRVFGVLFGCATVAQAQTTAVWPAAYANLPGESAQAAPFTISGANQRDTGRTITTITAASVPFLAGSVIDELAFRHDAHHAVTYGPATGFLYGWIGPVEDAMDPIARANQAIAGRSIIYHGQVSLPDSPPPQIGSPGAFDLVLPMRAPWTYPGGDFGIDLVFESTSGAALWRVDAVDVDDSSRATMHSIAAGCATSAGITPYGWIDVDTAHAGGVLSLQLDGAPLPIGGNALLVLGPTLTSPIDLSAAGFPAGCTLAVHPVITDLVTTGDASTQFARAWSLDLIPLVGDVAGHGLAAQWVLDDPNASVTNPVVTSNAFAFVVGAIASTPLTYGRSMFAYGYTAGSNHGMQIGPANYVPITRFRGALILP